MFSTLSTIVALALAFRCALIIYGEYHDAHSTLKYTDVDYRVFSDATKFLLNPSEGNEAQGILGHTLGLGDPYTRSTYRYTPLLAMLLIPNQFIHSSFGKILFTICDLLIGILLMKLDGASSTWVAALWLLNPLPANISTRGSAESVLGLFVIATLYFASKDKWNISAILLGAAVHFKIYPIIYGATLFVAVGSTVRLQKGFIPSLVPSLHYFATSSLSFLALGTIMYAIFGSPFLEHSYLYHIGRTDHRHNFSPYFYPLYLLQGRNMAFLAFLPQMIASFGSGIYLAYKSDKPVDNLPFIFAIQTICFVSLNKVCTSQYFLWFWWFLPAVVPRLAEGGMTKQKGIFLVILWVVGQAIWLSFGYKLEFLGERVYFQLWASGIIFLGINAYIIGELVAVYPLQGGISEVKKVKKS